MSRKTQTVPPTYFEEKYQGDIDPWRFRTSDYEKEKYAATVGALAKDSYPRALEVGCAIGVLSAMLATRCTTLLALDASVTAIAEAKQLNVPNITFEVRFLPIEFPAGEFDLIILSEVLYYFDAADLDEVAQRCAAAVKPGGEIILCHWLGETDYPLTGDQASEIFAKGIAIKLPTREIIRDETYRLERYSA
jgi:2-polyprenyl-3-methyl-5-hydroxy-6-metoxy-1,4-benzoquinol methylase